MSKILYFLFGRKTIVNATFTIFSREALRIIRQAATGHRSYITDKHDESGHFVISDMEGTEQFIDLSNFITN